MVFILTEADLPLLLDEDHCLPEERGLGPRRHVGEDCNHYRDMLIGAREQSLGAYTTCAWRDCDVDVFRYDTPDYQIYHLRDHMDAMVVVRPWPRDDFVAVGTVHEYGTIQTPRFVKMDDECTTDALCGHQFMTEAVRMFDTLKN